MPTSAGNGVGLKALSNMAPRTMPSSRRLDNTALRDGVNVTKHGKGEYHGYQAIVDLAEEEEEEGSSEDDGSEDEDQVTETGEAQSERGKENVFHHEIYHRLVKLMSRQGAYAYEPPDHGIDSMDITSFHPDQRDWSSTRPHRVPILTLWSEAPGSAPTYPIGYLLFNGRLILDYAGSPIRAFRHLPLTISSTVKGFRLEAWARQDIHRVRIDDIIARIRTRIISTGREPLQRAGNLYDRSNAFRLKSGLIPFRTRNNPSRNAARAYLDSLRTAAQRASNQAIDRVLTADELNTVKDIGRKGRVDAAAGSSANPSPRTPATTSAPALAITLTSQPTHRHHPSPPPQSAPHTLQTSAPTQSLSDSRDDVPKTCKESYILIEALKETVEHFKTLTRQTPKHTNTAKSYTSQWNALQAQFAPIWKSSRPAEETPRLFKLGKWTGGITRWDDDWRAKVGDGEVDKVDEVFIEYMDATAEDGAYVGRDGKWRSVRDTWCNSHRTTTEDRKSQSEVTSEEDAEDESSEQTSENSSEDSSEESSDESQ